MRILYLCPSSHLGLGDRAGWSTHMAAVILGLRAHGHAVETFLAARTGSYERASRPDRVKEWARRAAPAVCRRAGRDLMECLHDRSLDQRLLQLCRSFRPEAIYERTDIFHAVGMRVARHLDIPLVLEINGPLVDERVDWAGLLCPGYARRLEAAKYAAADAVLTVSAALGGYLAARGVDPTKIRAVPNGVDPTQFHPDRARPEAVRRELGLRRRLVIGFVGAFADWHGLETLVTAAGEIAVTNALDLHLLMLGEGPSRPRLRELAHRVGLEGRAALPGSVPHDQVPHYLAAMDLCVLPAANWYMSPVKLFEYGAMGRAIIAPRTPAVTEVMRDGEDGLLVPPGSREALVQAILGLGHDPDRRAAVGTAFQERVRQRHTWRAVAGRVAQVLEQACQARQQGEPPLEARAEGDGGGPRGEIVEAF